MKSIYSNKLICNILDYIDCNLYDKITIEDLENKYFYNRFYIMKLFKKEIGITIFDYINKVRINNSIIQINNTNDLLIKVAVDNGFYSIEYFSEIFKREVGISPKKFEKLMYSKYAYNDQTIHITQNIINIKKVINFAKKYRLNQKREIPPRMSLSIFH